MTYRVATGRLEIRIAPEFSKPSRYSYLRSNEKEKEKGKEEKHVSAMFQRLVTETNRATLPPRIEKKGEKVIPSNG